MTNGRTRPNILFIFTDDHRFDTLSALGNSHIDTPNLDRLMKKGTCFTHAHIMGANNAAVCCPSRNMLLTGRHLWDIDQDGGRGRVIPPEHTAMPEHFRAQGYVTAHTGKWHQDQDSHKRCFSHGTKIFGFRKTQGWYEACNGHWHIPVHDFDPDQPYESQEGYNQPPVTPFEGPFETCKDTDDHSVKVFSDAVIDFIREYPESEEGQAGKPWFHYLAHIAPHDPRQYPSRFRERYKAEDIPLPGNFQTQHFDNGDKYIRDELLASFPRRPEDIKQHIADYYALINFIDEYVGKILDSLEESGQLDNTLIVFSGDNGLAVGQHGLMGKQNLYDHSLRVPLILAGPGIPKDRKADTLCYLIDVFPTLCELCELPVPESVQGRSLSPALKDPETSIRDELLFAYRGVQRAVRMGDYKLIEYHVKGKRTTQLFDLNHDPLETQNLAEEPEQREQLTQMRNSLKKWRTDFADTQTAGNEFWENTPW